MKTPPVDLRTAFLAAACSLAIGSLGQDGGRQADVRIERLDVVPQGDLISVRIVIYSDNDASAQNTALHLSSPSAPE